MTKSYSDFMDEITADELYEGLLGYGLFSEKLPPVFTSVPFFKYCQTIVPSEESSWHDIISYNTMRNVLTPRQLGIPTPLKYDKLCRVLRDNWFLLQKHFKDQTVMNTYRVSRIHLRKQKHNKKLFEMNYKDWKTDGNPETDLLIREKSVNRYLVEADISTCFPSIYTHSIPWAIAGKEEAKKHIKDDSYWYNNIDSACQEMKNGETHGLIIGPHASNLISEIILTVVDKKLTATYQYYRNIDDYDCFVESYDQAQLFLRDLEEALREFDLPLNHKKTRILELPVVVTESWIHKLANTSLVTEYGKTTYKEVNGYLDLALRLMNKENDAAILRWAIKALSSHKLTDNAKTLASKRIMHLAILYPYLLQLIDEYVIKPYNVEKDEVKMFSDAVFAEGKKVKNDEAISYAIYFALKYDFVLENNDIQWILNREDCISMLLAYLYILKINHGYKNATELKPFKTKAKELASTDMDRNWLFCYEVLSQGLLRDDWQRMKKANVSFIKPEFVAKRIPRAVSE